MIEELNPSSNSPIMNKRKEEFLLKMSNWLDKHGIFYFLNFGTALKAYRDNEHDVDIDLGLFIKDKWKVRELLKTDLPEGVIINNLWRTEFTFRTVEDYYPKLDFNFYEEVKGNYQCYIYSKNPLNGYINWERAIKISKEVLSEFQDFKFANKKFKIPKNIELFLEEHYGKEWKIPDPDFKGWGKRPAANWNHREYAIIINTFLRDDKMRDCITSILETYTNGLVRIYLGDQNQKISSETQKFYHQLKKLGHRIFKLPYNCGLSFARNFLVKQTTEPYIMIIDDDFLFYKETNIVKFKDILDEKKEIGIVGGTLQGRVPYVGWLYPNLAKGKIYKVNIFSDNPITHKTIQYPFRRYQIIYYDTDIVLNFFLAKREVFDDIQWDNNLILVEHTDFFCRLKDTKWKVVFTPDIDISHSTKPNSKEYNNFRSNVNVNKGIERFCKKWNLKSLKDICKIKSKDLPKK